MTDAQGVQLGADNIEYATPVGRGELMIDVRDYGAVGDGVTDDTVAIQAALDAGAGKTVLVPEGRWVSTWYLDVRSNTTLRIEGEILCRVNAAGIRVIGTRGDWRNLAQDAPRASRTITLAAGHGLVVGDTLHIGSDQVFDGPSTNSSIGELGNVAAVDGNVVTLRTPLMGGPYTTAKNAQVAKVNATKSVRITGSGGIRGRRDPALNQTGILVFYSENVRIDLQNSSDFNTRHIGIGNSQNVRVSNMTFDWAVHNNLGYGVSVFDAVSHVDIEGCDFSDIRHAFSTNNNANARGIPRRIRFARNDVNWTSTALGGSELGGDAIDTHSAAEDIWIENNSVYGSSGGGINVECKSGRVVGNYVYGAARRGISFINNSDYEGSAHIVGNTVERCAEGFYVRPGSRGTTAGFSDITFTHNRAVDIVGPTVFIIGWSGAAQLSRNVMFTHNVAVRCTASDALIRIMNVTELVYHDNLKGTSSGPISVSSIWQDNGYIVKAIEPITTGTSGSLLIESPDIDAVSLPTSSGTTQQLTHIVGGRRGQRLTLRVGASGATVTIPHLGAGGNILLASGAGSTYTLTGIRFITFMSNGSNWIEMARS